MGKITGKENIAELPEKVLLLYKAVDSLIEEGADVAGMRVQEITERAGIGKGTAYDYFDSKEEIIVYGLLFYMENMMDELQRGIREERNFADRIRLALERMDTQIAGKKCALRFVAMLFDTTQMGELLRRTLEARKRDEAICGPLTATENLVRRGVEDGELRSDIPVSYMTYSLVARMVAYIVYLVSREKKGEAQETREAEKTDVKFRQYVLDGILAELCMRPEKG